MGKENIERGKGKKGRREGFFTVRGR
jgi:hypothetical protein